MMAVVRLGNMPVSQQASGSNFEMQPLKMLSVPPVFDKPDCPLWEK